jgi:hypothetical protein
MTLDLHRTGPEGERLYVLLLGRVVVRLRVKTLAQLSWA